MFSVIDNEHVDRSLLRLQLEAQLFLQRGKDRRTVGVGAPRILRVRCALGALLRRPRQVDIEVAGDFRALGAEEDIRPQFFRPGVNAETTILLLNSPTPVDALSTDLRSALGAIAEPL